MLEERTVSERGPTKNQVVGDTCSLTVVTENGHASKNGDAPANAPPTLPGYEILGLLGRGAKGVVYQARQLQLNRLVAVKMILAGPHASISDVLRFMGEAEAVANLHHPNIVQIYDVSQHDGLPYFVLEYVDGGSLQEKLRGAPVPPSEAAQLLESLARATHAAHQAGIVHRDLKPGNVLLTRGGQPKITDFGLAKRLEPGNSLTGSKDVLGTPSYMAPEQADGMRGTVGPRSDVYALGAILYELLTGRPPFRGVTTMDTLRQVVSEEPVPPRRLQPKIPADLETICLKALTKEPSRRYATAEDLADDLRRYARHEPIKARPAGIFERLWRWSRRNPVVASLIGLTVFSLALGFVLVFKAYRSESWQRYRAEVRLADSDLMNGIGLCENGNVHVGMLWMARGLRHIPPSAHELDRTIRMSMATWRVQLHQLEAIFQAPVNDVAPIPDETAGRIRQAIAVHAVAYSKDGKYVVSGAWAGFEARLWSVNGGEPIRTFFHGGPILAVACSPDSRYVVTGSRDSAKLWDLATGKEIRAFIHALPVFSVAFSPDGQRILTGSGTGGGGSGEACLWDVASGTQLASFPQKVPARSIAFHPNGRLFATASGETYENDNTACVWDIETKQLIGRMQHRGAVYAVAFAPDGKSVVTACGDKAAYLWNTSRFEPIKQPLWHEEAVTAVAFSPNGQTILTGSRDQTARAWDAATGRQRGAPLVHQDEVFAVACGPDNRSIVVGCRDGTARRWRISAPKPRPPEYLHDARVLSVAFSPNDDRIAIGCQNGVFDLWDAKTGAWVRTRDQHQSAVINVRFSSSGKYILTVSDDLTVRVWDPAIGTRLQKLTHPDDIRAATFSPDEAFIATACKDGRTRLWETGSGKLMWASDPGAAVRALAFHPDGTFLLTGDADGKAHRRTSLTGEAMGATMAHPSGIESIAVNSLGKSLLVGCADGTVWVWNLDTTTGGQLLPAHRVSVNMVTFSPDGRTALSCSADGLGRLWAVKTKRTIGPPLQHQRIVQSASFSPDGKLVLTGSQDHKAYLWSAETGKRLGPPIIHRGPVSAAAFDSTGRTILTGSFDCTARITELPRPIEGAAALVELELAVQLGAELDDTGGLYFLSSDEWKDRCNRWNEHSKR